eukprot:4325864-Prymnesium_polylepis.1
MLRLARRPSTPCETKHIRLEPARRASRTDESTLAFDDSPSKAFSNSRYPKSAALALAAAATSKVEDGQLPDRGEDIGDDGTAPAGGCPLTRHRPQ